MGLPRGEPALDELFSLPPDGHDAMRVAFLEYPSNGLVMAMRELRISGVLGVVQELSTPSKLLALPLGAPVDTLTFRLYMVAVFGRSSINL